LGGHVREPRTMLWEVIVDLAPNSRRSVAAWFR
jgi:hypothetical protein